MAAPRAKFTLSAEDHTRRAFASVRTSLRNTAALAKSVTATLAGVLGVGSLGAGLAGFKAVTTEVDRLGKLALRLGTSTRFLSEMRLVAEKSGISFDTFAMALQRMQRRIAEAANGTGEARGVLAQFGLDAQKLTRLPLEQQFSIIADKLSKVDGAGRQVAAAMKLFDSEGVALLQTLKGGAKGLEEGREQARQFGLSLSEDAVKAVETFNDKMAEAMGAVKGHIEPLVIRWLPLLTAWVELARISIQQMSFEPLRAASGDIDSVLTRLERLWKLFTTIGEFIELQRTNVVAFFDAISSGLRTGDFSALGNIGSGVGIVSNLAQGNFQEAMRTAIAHGPVRMMHLLGLDAGQSVSERIDRVQEQINPFGSTRSSAEDFDKDRFRRQEEGARRRTELLQEAVVLLARNGQAIPVVQ